MESDKKEKQKLYDKEYRKNNKERLNKIKKEWAKNNPDKIKEINLKRKDKKKITDKEYGKKNRKKISANGREWAKNNPDKIRKTNTTYVRNRRKTDILYRLKDSVGSLIRDSFRKRIYNKNQRTTEIVGCNVADFKKYIESKFEPWMNWDNYGKYNGTSDYGWDIDHIVPISSARTVEDVIKLNHYTNLRPLCSYINRYVKRNIIS